MSDLQSLISMGFSKERAEEALIETNNDGIELAIEWLLITDENNTTTNEAENSTKAEVSSFELEAVCESLKETKISCETKESGQPPAIAIHSEKKTRILVRLLDGKTLTKEFNTKEKLNAVLFWIQSHISSEEFGLMTNFPKKVFTAKDYEQSLDALNLVPSAVVIVAQLEKWDNLKVYHGIENDDEIRKAEERRRLEELQKQLMKKEEERMALERVRAQIEEDKAARRLRWPNLYRNTDQP